MPHPPLFLATAIEVVLRAGDIQLEHFKRGVRIEKKGVIDAVTLYENPPGTERHYTLEKHSPMR